MSRKKQGVYFNHYLLAEFEKYGLNAFDVDEIFDTAMTQDELNKKETYYIEKFDSYLNGYNMTFGGIFENGHKMPFGKDSPCSKSVCQISPDGQLVKVWDCLTDAAKALGLHRGAMSNVCSGRKETSGGFIWVYESDYDKNKDYSRIPKTRGGGKVPTKAVVHFDDNNNVIQEFDSLVDAATALGISNKEVCKICKHIRKKPKYNLKYKSEYLEEQRLNMGESCDAS